jgi:hypothetical protein
MLTEGAGSRSALEIADAVDFLGADLNASSGIDSSAVRLHAGGALDDAGRSWRTSRFGRRFPRTK